MNMKDNQQQQCLGRNRNLQRCGRLLDRGRFCGDHVWQPLVLLFILIFTVIPGTLAIKSHFWPHTSEEARAPLTKEDLRAELERVMVTVEPELKLEFPAGFILFATDGSTTNYRPRIRKVLFDADWDHVVVKANQERTKATIIIPDLALASGGIHIQRLKLTENISLKPGTSVQSSLYRSSGPSMWYKVFPSDHVTALFAIGFKE